jgi:hypothetical protein
VFAHVNHLLESVKVQFLIALGIRSIESLCCVSDVVAHDRMRCLSILRFGADERSFCHTSVLWKRQRNAVMAKAKAVVRWSEDPHDVMRLTTRHRTARRDSWCQVCFCLPCHRASAECAWHAHAAARSYSCS